MSRSSRLRIALLTLAVPLALARGGADETPSLVATRLSRRTMVLHAPGALSPRLTVFASDKGLVVFDTLGTPSQAAAARRRIEKEFGRRDFLWVINTHDHWDHWCGNQAFPEAKVVAHVSCPAEMKRPLEAAAHPAPSLRETVESWKKDLAGADPASENAARLRQRIASFQSAYEELGRVPRWLDLMGAVMAGDVKFAVPGHGDPLSKGELSEIGKYLKISWEGVEASVRQGLDADQVRERMSFASLRTRLDPALIDLKGLEAVHAANTEAFRRRLLQAK